MQNMFKLHSESKHKNEYKANAAKKLSAENILAQVKARHSQVFRAHGMIILV